MPQPHATAEDLSFDPSEAEPPVREPSRADAIFIRFSHLAAGFLIGWNIGALIPWP